MNDLILRARVHDLGDEILEKKRGSYGRGLTGMSRFIPGFGSTIEQAKGIESKNQYKQQRADARIQDQQAYSQKRRINLANKGINTRNYSSISPGGKTDERLKQAQADTKKLMGVVEENPVMDQQQQGTNQMPDTTQQFGGGNVTGGNVTDPNQQPQEQQQQQQQQQPMDQTGQQNTNQGQQGQGQQGGINSQVQQNAQQYQMGQDMNVLEQGKQGKESWLRNPDGSMKGAGKLGMSVLGGLATGGLSNVAGMAGRHFKNKNVDKKNQKFDQANSRMNMRAMGTTPLMRSLETHHDIYSIRKGIRERNTTHNLRR